VRGLPTRGFVLGLLLVLGLSLVLGAAGCLQATGRAPRPLPIPRRPGAKAEIVPWKPQGQVREGTLRLPQSEAGGEVELHWDKTSESIGAPNGGSLRHARKLPAEGPGWVCMSDRVYGTDETLLLLSWAMAEVERRFAGTAPVVVGDISAEGGGKLSPHRSHQSGRDADIGYYLLGNIPARKFERMNEQNFDAEKSWQLLENLLRTGEVMFVFVDYELQPLLYQAALGNGWADSTLAGVFQYPEGKSARTGIVRHSSGHADHFHVRFRCPRTDAACIP
jgi:hypothetical protein